MTKTLFALVATLLAGAAQAAGPVTIDLFSTVQAKLRDNTVGGVLSSEVGGQADTTILGGFRELILDQTVSPGFGDESSLGVSGGLLKYSNEYGTSSIATVRWDGRSLVTGGAINPTGLGGIFLGNTATDVIEMKIRFADSGYFFRIDAFTDANQWSTVQFAAVEHRSPFTSLIPMAAFLDCGNLQPPGPPWVVVSCGAGGPVDFSRLGALQVLIDLNSDTTALDLAVDQARALPVPEPASSALLLAGLALLGQRLRRLRAG